MIRIFQLTLSSKWQLTMVSFFEKLKNPRRQWKKQQNRMIIFHPYHWLQQRQRTTTTSLLQIVSERIISFINFIILTGSLSVVGPGSGMKSALEKNKSQDRVAAVKSGNRKTTAIGDVQLKLKSLKKFFDQSDLLNPEKMMILLNNHWQREHNFSPKVSGRDFHLIPLSISEAFWQRLQRRSEKREESALIELLAESIDKMAINPFGEWKFIALLHCPFNQSNYKRSFVVKALLMALMWSTTWCKSR